MGPDFIQCLSDGSWNGTAPFCLRKLNNIYYFDAFCQFRLLIEDDGVTTGALRKASDF